MPDAVAIAITRTLAAPVRLPDPLSAAAPVTTAAVAFCKVMGGLGSCEVVVGCHC